MVKNYFLIINKNTNIFNPIFIVQKRTLFSESQIILINVQVKKSLGKGQYEVLDRSSFTVYLTARPINIISHDQ